MPRSFNKVIVVGQPVSAGSPSDIILSAQLSCPDVRFLNYDISPAGLTKQLRASGQTVITLDQVGELSSWAPSGKTTTVIAPHLPTPRQLFDTQLPAYQWGGGMGILVSLAGWSVSQASQLFNLPAADFQTGISRLCQEVEACLQGRALRILTLTDRPLLGADSVLVADPDSLPVHGIPNEDMQRVHALYQAVKNYLLQRSLLAPGTRDDRDWNPARAQGAGAGYGLAALTPVLKAFRGRALEVFSAENNLSAEITSDSLLVATLPVLHPQTAAESALGLLKELSEASGAALIAFADETSLSKHELYEWNANACYCPDYRLKTVEQKREYYTRVLTQTWLRTR